MYLWKAPWNCVPLLKLSSCHFDVCFYGLDMLFCYYQNWEKKAKKKQAKAPFLEPQANWILYLKVNFIKEITQISHSPFPAGSHRLDASLNLVWFTLFICRYSTRDLFMLRCSLMSFPLHCYGIFFHSFWSRCCQSQTLKAIIPLTFNALDQGEFYFTTFSKKNKKFKHRSGCSSAVTRSLGVSLLFSSRFNNASTLFVLNCKPLCGGQPKIYHETLNLSKPRPGPLGFMCNSGLTGDKGRPFDCSVSLQHMCLSLTRPTAVVTDVIKTSWGTGGSSGTFASSLFFWGSR